MFDLSGKTAIVTGGNGKLGSEFCNVLLEYGANVYSLDVSNSNKDNNGTVTTIKEALKIDITQKEEIESALLVIKNKTGIPNILINCAAIDCVPRMVREMNNRFEDISEESFRNIFDVNVIGTMLCCQVIGGAMARGQGGSIINISSTYGLLSPKHSVYETMKHGESFKPIAYCVSKAAILNLTRYLATYWAKKSVRVNSLTPAGVFDNQDEEFVDKYTKHVPMGRMANRNELNGAIIFLASNASSYMTGANLVVDGGWCSW